MLKLCQHYKLVIRVSVIQSDDWDDSEGSSDEEDDDQTSGSSRPTTPGTPATPLTPAAPATPATPASSVTPVTPATPSSSVAPVTPATPASSVAHVTSDTPAAPVTPASYSASGEEERDEEIKRLNAVILQEAGVFGTSGAKIGVKGCTCTTGCKTCKCKIAGGCTHFCNCKGKCDEYSQRCQEDKKDKGCNCQGDCKTRQCPCQKSGKRCDKKCSRCSGKPSGKKKACVNLVSFEYNGGGWRLAIKTVKKPNLLVKSIFVALLIEVKFLVLVNCTRRPC